MTTGWKLDRGCRAALLRRFPPSYQRVIADHVTLNPGTNEGPPGEVREARVVGRADDETGVEAYVVALGGSTTRPDGGTWHITWSLAAGREPRESNDVIAGIGWQPVEPAPLDLVPAQW